MADDHDDAAQDSAEFSSYCPFWIDTDAYSDRDRAMFVAGYEFAIVLAHIERDADEFSTTIHRENESRIRMACGRFGRRCEIEQCSDEHDPAGTWSFLRILAAEGREVTP
jgi:hypothetical protein